MRGSRKFCQRGSNFDNVFFVDDDKGREDPKTTKAGHHQTPLNGVSLACL